MRRRNGSGGTAATAGLAAALIAASRLARHSCVLAARCAGRTTREIVAACRAWRSSTRCPSPRRDGCLSRAARRASGSTRWSLAGRTVTSARFSTPRTRRWPRSATRTWRRRLPDTRGSATGGCRPELGRPALKGRPAGRAGSRPGQRPPLAEGNAAYERRFGHIYLACATGQTAAELLAFLRERLDNDPGAERRVVAAELAKINQIRLRKLVGQAGAGAATRAGAT